MTKILVIDDEMSIRLLYGEELKEEGYEVFTAENGFEGLLIAGKNLVDLVILDIKMAEMDGIETLRLLKKHNPHLIVLLSTAYSEYKQDFATWASDEYLVKSSDLCDIFAVVNKMASGTEEHWPEFKYTEVINNIENEIINLTRRGIDAHDCYFNMDFDKYLLFYDSWGYFEFIPKQKIIDFYNDLLKAKECISRNVTQETSNEEIEKLYLKQSWRYLSLAHFLSEAEYTIENIEIANAAEFISNLTEETSDEEIKEIYSKQTWRYMPLALFLSRAELAITNIEIVKAEELISKHVTKKTSDEEIKELYLKRTWRYVSLDRFLSLSSEIKLSKSKRTKKRHKSKKTKNIIL